jgi:uncharacterized membrane protein YbhN (UPF0104 family)
VSSPSSSALSPLLARLRSRRARRALGLLFLLAMALVAALAVRHFLRAGWPLARADAGLLALAAFLFACAFALKALGWRRVCARQERPAAHALAAASGAATVTGVALPGRFDDAVRVAVARRFRGCRIGLPALLLSIVVVGFLDSAALAPLASVAAGLGQVPGWVRVGLALLAAAGVGAWLSVVAMPRLVRLRSLARFRLVRWLAGHSAGTRDSAQALLLVLAAWSLRAVALFVLLHALGLRASFLLALLFLCASAASAALPVAPAGAATQAGAGAAVLALSGMGAAEAVAFALAAQALLVLAGASVLVAAGAWEARLRLRSARAAA